MSCTGICGVASVSHRSWSASSITQRLGMRLPNKSHHLPAAVITPTVVGALWWERHIGRPSAHLTGAAPRCCGGEAEIESLTPCMPSRDPHHSGNHEPSCSRALHHRRRAGEWCYVRVCRAELLREPASAIWETTSCWYCLGDGEAGCLATVVSPGRRLPKVARRAGGPFCPQDLGRPPSREAAAGPTTPCRSHKETWVGCMVSSTTLTRSAEITPRSTWLRRRALNASMMRTAS
jgi:hypothetical protein